MAVNPWPVFVAFTGLLLCVVISLMITRFHLHAIPETGTPPALTLERDRQTDRQTHRGREGELRAYTHTPRHGA
jgi:hypothetical protein